MAEPFLLGVNYWPRRKAMAWWSQFERDEVARDFDLIADLGLTTVRIFLLWEAFQPDPRTVSAARLADLATVCDLAHARGLRLNVTFFTGHMSGPNWPPPWLLETDAAPPAPNIRQVVSRGRAVEGYYRNMFHDREALAGERLLLERVVGQLRQHPAIWLWNLGNEPDLFAHPHSAADGHAWVREMCQRIRALDPEHPVTVGLHSDNLLRHDRFRVDQAFAETDLAVMHGYPMYVSWAREPLDAEFVPFLCALTSALCHKPCLAEEWGGPTAPGGAPSSVWRWRAYHGREREQFVASEQDLARYVEQVLPRLLQVGATGSMLWCFADYHPSLWDRPPCEPSGSRHERHFGLVRPDGSLKPHAGVLRRFAATRPTVQPARRTVQLDVSADAYYTDPARHGRRLYERFVQQFH